MSDAGKAVFLSYASQDAEAAKRIADALRAAGVEVWFDQSELVGGDAWDQKIRRQIKECALLIPIISENTQARTEGYFRLEWRLADQRTHLMAKGRAFLLPVVIDDTSEADAAVPDSFLDVQWTRLRPAGYGGQGPREGEDPVLVKFVARVRDLLEADPSARTKVPRFKGQWSNSPLPESVTDAPSRRPRWLAPVLGGVAVAIVAVVLARPWDRPAPVSSLPPPASAAPSEARQLAERAMAIRRQTEVTVEDLMAAAGMCDRALALDSLDAQVWAAASMVDTRIVQAEYDKSDTRRQQAQKKAARALVLAPGGFEPRWAQALAFAYAAGTPEMKAEAEKLFRALAKEEAAAGRRDFQIDFGTFLRDTGQMAEAAAIFERLGDLLSAGWNYFAARDAAAAERVVERMLATERTPGAVLLKVFIAGVLRQDFEAAHAAVDLFTPTELLNASPVRVAIYIRLSQRQPERVIALVNAFPQDFIFAAGVAQPKRYFSGLAHEMAGREAAARAEWQVALQQVAERLKATPNDRDMVAAHALLLACLGEKEAAEREFQLLRNLSGPAGIKSDEWWIGLRLGHTEEALAALTQVLRGKEPNWWFVHLGARTQVQWDPLRGDPRFEKLLRETLPLGAKPFEDDKTTDNGPLTTVAARDSAFAKATADASGPTSSPDAKSVAVLAFANLSEDKANEYFSDGISEELLNQLGKVPGLRVAGRTSAFSFKGQNVPEAEIAGKLGVAYVVTGSVQKSGSQVRIAARLVKAADGFQVWSEKFTRDLKDIFAVQDEIAGLIAQNLQLKLDGAARTTRVVNPEAHRLLLEGRYFWNRRNEEGFTRGEAAFTKALELEPNFAEAHSGLAGVCVIREMYRQIDGLSSKAGEVARARAEAQRAIALDPALGEPHAVLGYTFYLENRLDQAEGEFQRALALNPSDPVVRCWHALALAGAGRHDEALREYERAAELDPLWYINLQVYAWELTLVRRFEEADRVGARAKDLRPDVFVPHLGRECRVLFALGRKDEAVAAARQVRQMQELRPRWEADSAALAVLRDAGFEAEAQEFGAELLGRLDRDSYVRGFVLGALGRFDEALPYLRNTPPPMLRRLYLDPMWDPWRDSPRWAELIASLGRTSEYAVSRATLARLLREKDHKK